MKRFDGQHTFTAKTYKLFLATFKEGELKASFTTQTGQDENNLPEQILYPPKNETKKEEQDNKMMNRNVIYKSYLLDN
ncbi:hypothetical protein [Legionella gresilensis]|uniref:hypothetical protein n=1 Tax=Legionella gresilensis TaxID=91823 RepID=UPI001041B780|nr:hypothetical protein [Legionella gresilensis]